MKNYKIYTIALLLLGFTACSTTHINPDKDNIRACTREYMPVCGEVKIECATTPCTLIMKTFPNACVLANNKRARFLYNGACR